MLALFAVGSALPPPGDAQVLYGSIVGNVEDSSGATLPGATVTITSQETNLTRTAVTNERAPTASRTCRRARTT